MNFDISQLSTKFNNILNLNTSNIIQWNSPGNAGQVINYGGKSYRITHNFLSNTNLLLTDSGFAIPEQIVSDANKVLSERVLFERQTKPSLYKPRKKIDSNFASLVAVYEDDLVKFKLFGLQNDPITVFEIPQQDESYFEITGPTSNSNSGSIPGVLTTSGQSLKADSGMVYTNSIFKITGTASASVNITANNSNFAVIAPGARVSIQNISLGAVTVSSGGLANPSVSDSQTYYRFVYGSIFYQLYHNVGRTPGTSIGGNYSSTAFITTEVIDTPMLYQARISRNGDILHIVISYGRRDDRTFDETDSQTLVDSLNGRTSNCSISDVPYGSSTGDYCLFNNLPASGRLRIVAIWNKVAHIIFNAKTKQVISSNIYNADSLPGLPDPSIPLSIWQKEISDNLNFTNVILPSLYSTQNVCLVQNYAVPWHPRNSYASSVDVESFTPQIQPPVRSKYTFNQGKVFDQSTNNSLWFIFNNPNNAQTNIYNAAKSILDITDSYNENEGESTCSISGGESISDKSAKSISKVWSPEKTVPSDINNSAPVGTSSSQKNQNLILDFVVIL